MQHVAVWSSNSKIDYPDPGFHAIIPLWGLLSLMFIHRMDFTTWMSNEWMFIFTLFHWHWRSILLVNCFQYSINAVILRGIYSRSLNIAISYDLVFQHSVYNLFIPGEWHLWNEYYSSQFMIFKMHRHNWLKVLFYFRPSFYTHDQPSMYREL